MDNRTLKRILLSGLLFVGSSLGINAQHSEGETTFQPRVGISISNLTNDTDAKAKVNLTYGVEIEHYFTENFSFAGGLLFLDQGAKYNDEGVKSTMNNYYTALPLTVGYYPLPGLALRIGVQPALRVNTKIRQGGQSLDVDRFLALAYDGNDDVKLNKFDLSIPIGLSYEFKNVVLDARYNFGCTKVISGSGDKSRNSVFTITLGYKI